MSDDKIEAVDRISDIVKIAIRGWPIYGVILGILWGYGELWLDKKIQDAIATKTLELPVMVTVTGDVTNNKQAITRIEGKVEEVEGDTKAILRHLAGQPIE